MSETPVPAQPLSGSDDDQQWFELMAGRSAGDVKPETRNEAAWLRAAMLSYQPLPPPGEMPDAATRAQRLLEKAEQAGLLVPREVGNAVPVSSPISSQISPPISPPSSPPISQPVTPVRSGWSRAWAWLRRPRHADLGLAAMAAGVVAGVVLVNGRVALPEAPSADVERGAAVQQFTVEDPYARQQALLQGLRAAGIEAVPYEQLGRRGVDIALAVPLPPAQGQLLASLGLRPPGGPSLRVELIQTESAVPAAPAASAAGLRP